MPAGGPGDHPLTDILYHGGSEFGPEIDDLVLLMADSPGFPEIRDELADLLLAMSPYWRLGERAAARETLLEGLAALSDRLV